MNYDREREYAATTIEVSSVSRTLVVTATTPEGRQAAFVVQNPPTSEDVRRLAVLGAMPGLRDATWTTAPGTSSR